MIAQDIDFTRHLMKERRISDYGRLKKMSCGIKRQARARVIHELSGLEFIADSPLELLGLTTMIKLRGNEWKAEDSDIERCIKQYTGLGT